MGIAMLASLLDSVGVAAWSLVAAGFTLVAVVSMYGGRPRPQKIPYPVEVAGQQPTKITHSQIYTPPPYRQNYRTNRRRR